MRATEGPGQARERQARDVVDIKQVRSRGLANRTGMPKVQHLTLGSLVRGFSKVPDLSGPTFALSVAPAYPALNLRTFGCLRTLPNKEC